MDVAVGGVYDGSITAFSRFGFYLLASVEIPWFLVLHVSSGFADVGFVGEDVEANLARAGRYKHWISFFGFL